LIRALLIPLIDNNDESFAVLVNFLSNPVGARRMKNFSFVLIAAGVVLLSTCADVSVRDDLQRVFPTELKSFFSLLGGEIWLDIVLAFI
jgi:hypothetical protein